MRWIKSFRTDRQCAGFSDRHYSRQTPGSAQFAPPGRCLVLKCLNDEGLIQALWVTSWPFSEYVRHDWAGSWVCSLFRNESDHLSSELIIEAIQATRWYHTQSPSWVCDPEPPGMITFVRPEAIKSKNPGYCYQCAGFKKVGHTRGGLPALWMSIDNMPKPLPPDGSGTQVKLF